MSERMTDASAEEALVDGDFPLAPSSVTCAYDYYWRVTHLSYEEGKSREHAMRETNTYISDFCNTQITSQVYTAAMLSGIIDDNGDSLRRPNVLRSLKLFAETSDESEEDKRSIFGLLSDRPIIHDFWHQQTIQLYQDDPTQLTLLTDETNTLPVSDDAWKRKTLGAKATEILRLRTEYGVNIESFLIEAAETLEWLTSDKAKNDTATLQKLHAAEALYAPFCEIIGFDGLAMALQGRCHELRLINTGRGKFVDQARAIIASLGDPETVQCRVETMFTEILGENAHEQVISHLASHGIIIGEGVIRNDHYLDELIRVVWREKSVGSVARKLAQFAEEHENYQELYEQGRAVPMDIIAATVIADDAAQIGVLLDSALQHAIDSEGRAKLVPSPSRDKFLHAKGTSEFIDAIRSAMGLPERAPDPNGPADQPSMDDYVDIREVGPDEYQVAKITFSYQRLGEPLPILVEIQFNTKEGRKDARIGSPAHAFFKLTGGFSKPTPEDIAAIVSLHAQKEHLGQNGLTPLSRQRADALMADVSATYLSA